MLQRKIGTDQWSVRAIRFTQTYIYTAKQKRRQSSPPPVLNHRPLCGKRIYSLAFGDDKRKSKQTLWILLLFATEKANHTHLFIKTTDFDAETTKLTLDVLNKMSKKQCLYLLSALKKNGVVLQDAIAYISGLNNKVKNWFSSIHALPLDKIAGLPLMQAKSERSQKPTSFLCAFILCPWLAR